MTQKFVHYGVFAPVITGAYGLPRAVTTVLPGTMGLSYVKAYNRHSAHKGCVQVTFRA